MGKVLAWVATLLTMFAIAPLTAKAEIQTGSVDGVTEGEITWSYDTETKVVTVTGSGTRTLWDSEEYIFPLEAEKVQFTNCSIKERLAGFFAGMSNLQSVDFSGLTMCNVTDMESMFEGCSSLTSLDLNNFDTSNVIWMEDMFYGCSSLTSLDVSSFDTSNVSSMHRMFADCSSLTSLDVSVFDTSNVKNMGIMFADCRSLKSLNLSNFDTSNVTDMYQMFNTCDSLTELNVSNFDTSNVTDMRSMFGYCSSLLELDVSNFDTSNVSSMENMFTDCRSLTELDVGGFDTSNVSSMRSMFGSCKLKNLDVRRFDTSNVTDMCYMFRGCSNLTSLDVSNFDTSNVTNMEEMLYGCSSLTSLDLSSFDTSSVTNMYYMFHGCSGLTSLDLSGFDTGNVTNMGGMFCDCSGLTSLELAGFDTSNVTSMPIMFLGCSRLASLDLSGFNTSNVIEIFGMFSGCSSLTSLDLSGFDTTKVTDARHMLWKCENLQNIKTPRIMGNVNLELPGTYQYGDQTTTYVAKDYFTGVELHKVVEGTPPIQTEQQEQMVEDFVSRMYEVALGREADEGGLNYWKDRLISGEIDGAGIADGFMKSQELKDKNLDDGAYLDTLYEAFFGRTADEGGKNDWLKRMSEGMSREQVLAGFSNSDEFGNLCDDFGIAQGILKDDGVPINAGIVSFVERIYTKALGRESDRGGLTDWAGQIDRREKQPVEVAKQFFFSEEYTNHGYDDGEFVETLYLTFMGRESDEGGKNHWINKLTTEGWTREQVLDSFASSEEFSNIMKGFGL